MSAVNVPSSSTDADRGYARMVHHEPVLTAGASPETQPSVYSISSDVADNSSTSSLDESTHRPLIPGVYVPTFAFFDDKTEDLDLATTAQHAVRLARAGVAGLATQGSNGEAVHLTTTERNMVTRTTRRALDDAGFHEMPLIVGCGAQSTREAITLCRDAFDAGGDYALVLPPSYYRGLFSQESVTEYFLEVAQASPIPLLVYNYPQAVGGMDLDSDTIIKLSRHGNIVGCKLTCGNTGKLNRIVAGTGTVRTGTGTGNDNGNGTGNDNGNGNGNGNNEGFMCFGGSADFTLQTLLGGGAGIIAGLANVTPKACVELMNSWQTGKIKKAKRLQEIVARGDWVAIRRGLVGTKAVLQEVFGYGGFARKPLPRPGKEEVELVTKEMEEVLKLERSL
ncbi:MAG: hypothetical protein M1823_005438 [Watsoniomyces obsoletus]|nr:MAG: hypothetical protein M1823_005438 [Watsoniomyces obsoletus]